MTVRAFATLAMLMVAATWVAWAGQFDPTKKVDPSQVGNPGQYASATMPAGWTDLGAKATHGEILACVSPKDKDHPQARIVVHVLPNVMKVTVDDIQNPAQFFPESKMDELEKNHVIVTHINLGGNPGVRADADNKEGIHAVQAYVLIAQPDRLLTFVATCPSQEWPKFQDAILGCLASIHIF